MAYSAPSTITTGTLITAAKWNADVVANPIAIYAGAMSVSSQAVGDILYASSTTQLGRVGIGSANKVLTSTGSAPQWVTQIANAALPTNIDVGGTLDVTGATTLDSTLAVSSTAATAIDVAGGITAGTGNVALVGTDGKINGPLSSTIIDDLSGANLTTLNASNVSSGTLANARLPSNVDLGGTLDVTGATTLDSTLTVVNDVAVDTDTLFVDVSADNVGIGVTDPDVALDVSGGDNVLDIFRITQRVSGAAAYGLQVGLADTGDPVFQRLVNDTATESFRIVRGTGVVKFNANVGIGTTTPTSPSGVNRILEIEDGTHAGLVLHDSTADAWEIYANSTDISFAYNNSVKTRIEGDTGQVGIGTASPGARLEIEDGGISHPGPLLIVRQDTDDVWNTVLCNDAYSATALHGCRMTVGTGGDFALYAPDKGSSPGDIKFYTDEAERVAILAAGGMTFNGDTAAANALDDYEEGSWSPVPQGSSGSLGSGAHNMNGTYTKVGRLCVATCYGYFTNLGSWSGDLQITGLPFTHGVGQVTQGTIGQFPFGTPEDDEVWITVMFPAGGTHMNFRQGYNMDVVVPFSIVHGTGMAFSITVSFYV